MTDKQIHFDGINVYRRGETISYGVGILPGNVRVSLFKKENERIISIATFPKLENAVEFTKFLERLANDVNRRSSAENLNM